MTYDIMYDYDDIIVEMVPALHKKAFELGLHDNSIPHLSTWAGNEQYECTEEVWWSIFDHLMTDGWYYNTPAGEGIRDDMIRLKEAGHRIHVVTARGFMKYPDEIRKATYKNIETLDLPVDTVTFDRDKVNGMITALGGWTPPDARPTFDFAIDDGAHNYEHLDAAGVNVYLREVPHNEEWRKNHPEARTVPTVGHFVNLILDS